jgi:predicted nucleic acid-binding Zn finger protein
MVSRQQIHLLDRLLCDKEGGKSTDSSCNALRMIGFILFDNSVLIEHCLEIIDDPSRPIRKIINSSSTRCFWKVPSSSKGKDYVCLKEFCSCRSYFELAKSTSDKVLCKHLATVRIATALDAVQTQVLPEISFVEAMCEESLPQTKPTAR